MTLVLLERRFARIGGDVVEIPWPSEVVEQFHRDATRLAIRDMIEMDVFMRLRRSR